MLSLMGIQRAVVWSGLGLIDFSIVPHFRSDHPETQVAELAVDYFTEHGIPFKTLADGDVIVRSGDSIEILCNG
jgi:dipeptidase E